MSSRNARSFAIPAHYRTRWHSKGLPVFFAFTLFCGVIDRSVAQSPPYHLSQTTQEAQIFAPGIISTDAIEYSVTFTPDGQTVYFTRRLSWRDNPAIYMSQYQQGVWQEPEIVSFSGTYSDEYPSLTPSGDRLYFASKRPAAGTDTQSHNDIWFVERTSDGWGEPQHVAAPISTEFIDSHPLVAEDGTLYFHSNREGGQGGVDMYKAQFQQGQFAEPQLLPFNSDVTDGEVIPDPAGRFIIFYSERAGTRGKGDLFIVYPGDGTWSSVRNLGDLVNTPEYEWTPSLSPDGRYLFYAHLVDNDSDIYQIDLDLLLESQ